MRFFRTGLGAGAVGSDVGGEAFCVEAKELFLVVLVETASGMKSNNSLPLTTPLVTNRACARSASTVLAGETSVCQEIGIGG